MLAAVGLHQNPWGSYQRVNPHSSPREWGSLNFLWIFSQQVTIGKEEAICLTTEPSLRCFRARETLTGHPVPAGPCQNLVTTLKEEQGISEPHHLKDTVGILWAQRSLNHTVGVLGGEGAQNHTPIPKVTKGPLAQSLQVPAAQQERTLPPPGKDHLPYSSPQRPGHSSCRAHLEFSLWSNIILHWSLCLHGPLSLHPALLQRKACALNLLLPLPPPLPAPAPGPGRHRVWRTEGSQQTPGKSQRASEQAGFELHRP